MGAAQVTISPPASTPMAGYYSTRLSTGVHDDLHAKAIVIASGAQRVALVACDLVGIPPAVVEEAREMVQNSTGIPAYNIMISATHSHSIGNTPWKFGFGVYQLWCQGQFRS